MTTHPGDASRDEASLLSDGVLGQPFGLLQLIKLFANLHSLPLLLVAGVKCHREDEKQKGRERHDKRQAEKRQNGCESVPTENDLEKETQ
jgi:hypothetical protein